MAQSKVENILGNKLTSFEEAKLRVRDGLYIKHRKRVYLYWFKFLQEAEKSPDHKVRWVAYRGWGGSNEILGTKFDDWWEDNWKGLFGVRTIPGVPKFDIQKKVRLERIRLSYLAYMLRDTPNDYIQKERLRFHGSQMGRGAGELAYDPVSNTRQSKTNTLSIAYKIYKSEKSKKRWGPIAHLNPDDESFAKSGIQGEVRKLIKGAHTIMANVSVGRYP